MLFYVIPSKNHPYLKSAIRGMSILMQGCIQSGWRQQIMIIKQLAMTAISVKGPKFHISKLFKVEWIIIVFVMEQIEQIDYFLLI